MEEEYPVCQPLWRNDLKFAQLVFDQIFPLAISPHSEVKYRAIDVMHRCIQVQKLLMKQKRMQLREFNIIKKKFINVHFEENIFKNLVKKSG